MKAFGEAVGLIIALVVLVWASLIYFAYPDVKPVVACKPLLLVASGLQTTAAAASSTNANSADKNSRYVARTVDSTTGLNLTVADRAALACLRFTDRLFNK